ncbi:sialin isoform X1 [Brachionus plicatilis]|uniref:Sialin isoform X1 n=1 Tax=Brachionus plicatilis TaxID=10195 RepID=A0A3M7RB27_BRAPC|nr:sialin isoform X1 [Brachionus plicatilis]
MKEPLDPKSTPSLLISVRFLLALVIFFGVALQYMQKIDMGISIVVMVNSTAIQQNDPNHHLAPSTDDANDTCLFKPDLTNSTKDSGSFEWSKSVQGLILSSYFYGYIFTQIPGGWLSMKYGPKTILGVSMLIGSIFTILIVPSAQLGYGVLMACRFLIGLSHGMMWPAISAMFIKWAPPFEKSRIIGFATSGANIGNVIALPLGGFLCGLEDGWKLMFYLFGSLGILWFILFVCLTADSPHDHRFISSKEKSFVISHTCDDFTKINEEEPLKVKVKRSNSIPWMSIFTSKACIAIFTAHLCHNWGNYMFLTQLPSFMKDVLRFDIKSNGLFSSIPYISCWTCAMISSVISDRLILSGSISKSSIRKIFNGIGLLVPMVSVILLSLVTCANPYMGVVLLAFGVGFLGCNSGAGFQVNINEIGGEYSGILFGISNTFATISGIVSPYIVGVMTPDSTQHEWQHVFYLTAAIYLFGAIVYILFSKATVEKWAQNSN